MTWLSQNWVWVAVAAAALFFMIRRRGHGHHRHAGHANADVRPESAVDPVTRHAVGANAPSAVYQGRAYYFENAANRSQFEQEPERYLAESGRSGVPVEQTRQSHHRHRHGC